MCDPCCQSACPPMCCPEPCEIICCPMPSSCCPKPPSCCPTPCCPPKVIRFHHISANSDTKFPELFSCSAARAVNLSQVSCLQNVNARCATGCSLIALEPNVKAALFAQQSQSRFAARQSSIGDTRTLLWANLLLLLRRNLLLVQRATFAIHVLSIAENLHVIHAATLAR